MTGERVFRDALEATPHKERLTALHIICAPFMEHGAKQTAAGRTPLRLFVCFEAHPMVAASDEKLEI